MRRLQVIPLLALAFSVTNCAPLSMTDATVEHAQLFDGMGAHERDVTTAAPEAHEYFNQGLNWMYSFNHDEAIRCFKRAASIDPNCAMAWWGVAICEGPNYNDPEMTEERSIAAWGALQEAVAHKSGSNPKEQALIDALAKRYANPWPEDRTDLEAAYASAMAEVWATYPDDPDVGTLYAEAMMVKRPWKLYTLEKEPEAETPMILATLERVMELDPSNPGANHLYVHAVEPSHDPGKALAAADRLGALIPASGHMNHMPSHIYVQVGEWDKSITQNTKAVEADAIYRALSPEQGLQHMYMVHNAHMLAYSAMMVGREEVAMKAARSMWDNIPAEVLESVAPFVDLWMTSVYDVQKRFGRWDDILDESEPPKFLPITNAVWRAHRAIAWAAKKDFAAAQSEYDAFRAAMSTIPDESVFGGDSTHTILAVSDHFIAGEIALQQGDWDEAAKHLLEAVAAEDTLSYGEPPQWLQPTRHTLGAVYLSAHRFDDAERVYREDLHKWPGNGWSLYGLARALEGEGKMREASTIMQQHLSVWRQADAPTTTSCLCLPEPAAL